MSQEKVKEMRPVGELSESIAAQIALGVIDSLEAAEKDKQEDALEYCAQSLFDMIRMRTAEREKLPPHIVRWLVKDRTPRIRYITIRNHFDHVPDEDREKFYAEAEGDIKESSDLPVSMVYRTLIKIIMHVFKVLRDDELTVRLLQITKRSRGYDYTAIDKSMLRDMPLTCAYMCPENIYEMDETTDEHLTARLFHPDTEVRLKAVKWCLNQKVSTLRTNVLQPLHGGRKEVFTSKGKFTTILSPKQKNIKEILYDIIAEDPAPIIRLYLLRKISHNTTLAHLAAHDPHKGIREAAEKKVAIMANRREYSRKYNEKKAEEKRD